MTNDTLLRTQGGNALKAAFNLMWDKAIHLNKSADSKEFLSYRDMTRIADAIRAEGPGILGLKTLPPQIDGGLYLAVSVVDPNKARIKENIKKSYSALGGFSGAALIMTCLGQILNPGVWASIAVFFAGGSAAGTLAPIGIAAGIAVLVGSVYLATQKMSPKERAVKSHDIFMRSIDAWMKNGDKQNKLIDEESQRLTTDALHPAFTTEERAAVLSILSKIAIMDGDISQEENDTIERAASNKDFTLLDEPKALEILKSMTLDKKKEFLVWCFSVSTADKKLDNKETEYLKKLSTDLDVDYNSIYSLFLG